MSEVIIQCLREDQSIDEVFSVEGSTLDEFMSHLVTGVMCPLKNYISKMGGNIKYLNIYYDNEPECSVTLDEDYYSGLGDGSQSELLLMC